MSAKSLCESRGSLETAAAIMRQPLAGGEDALVRYRADLRALINDATEIIEIAICPGYLKRSRLLVIQKPITVTSDGSRYYPKNQD